MEKGVVPAAVAPPPPPAPIPEQVAPPPDFVRSGHTERVIGSDPVVSPVEFQRQLQRLQIGEQDQQAMYGRKNDDNLVGGYSGSGDYYVQKMPEKAPPVTAAPPAGYWPEISSGGFPGIGAPEQPMYMLTSAPGGGAVYHAQPPMVRPVTGPPGQEYYHVQPRVGSEIYREQPPRYNVVPQPQQQQPSTLPPQPPKYVATYADTTPYAQVAYDSTTGRQVYYSAPGGVVQQQQQAYQAVGPAAVGGEMRAAGALGQEGKVVGSKLPQASV
ncbi:hypothetical protein C1H46_011822 [Malus baccata]|uniref:Uncharacterized protein n=1 Tax=Malus baccata TaxID=106549 RepID=A0A540MUZ8_MALBA|nr:hypothetical protein C1H46_011822 [Malus baccata]